MNRIKLQLPLQTLSLIAGFAVWGILSSLIPFIKEDIHLTPAQLSWVTAIPVVLGSLLRIPIGYLTNRYGARFVFSASFILLLPPVLFISYAGSFRDLILGGLFLGIGGAVFSVGVTSLPKYYPKERHGFVNGVFGMGNLGSAVSTFFAPVLANHLGWENTVRVYLILLAVFIVGNMFLGDPKEPKVKQSLTEQFKSVYKNEKLWYLCLFYFITFGVFVAFTVYLPNFLSSHFQLDKVDAGLRTAGFIILATLLRPVGGWLGDRFNAYKILMAVFAGLTLSGILLAFTPSLGLYTAGCLSIAVFAGIGNGAVFKLVPMYFSKQAGIANGIISAMGGLGGFFPPLILSGVFSLTGQYSIGFILLSMAALSSMVIAVFLYQQGEGSRPDNSSSGSEGIYKSIKAGKR